MTNPLGKYTHNVCGNVGSKVYGDLLELAKQSGVGVSTYVACLMYRATKRKTVVKNAKAVRAMASI